MSQVSYDPSASSAAVARAAAPTLDLILRAALASVPGFSFAGFSVVYRDGWVDTVAATDRLVWEIDALQFALDEGPSLGALREAPVVVVSNLADDQRWARYGIEAARRAGVRSQLVVRVYLDQDTHGALSLYSTKNTEIDPDAAQLAMGFADRAALAMGRPAA